MLEVQLRERKPNLYFVGLDLGKNADYAALSILEQQFVLRDRATHRVTSNLFCVHLERFPLETKYPRIVDRAKVLMDNPTLQLYGKLIVDETGVGIAVVDYMRQEGLKPIGVTIMREGTELREREGGFNVPKKDIVGATILVFQSGRLKIASGLPLAPVLDAELQNFREKANPRSGTKSYEAWHESDKDDLVMCLALPIWYATRKERLVHNLMEDEVDSERAGQEYDPLHRR